ncbi:pseudaminic acid synthase [Marinomonas ostreistagni]|uniref:pseudaminic acid synthase n=1 Tax=Marinomonas ostreistagni TaxID=359209 RepID=UPI00194EA814|nr:pseudaminic acid synthase [Marinomonas ostreistagni]MBM6551149.1 pseudaminic acid synthase [Marinomonas ostreistagni]
MDTLHIDGREIGPNHPPYIIAELSANHNGSLENALQLIEIAKNAGADAVKLQTYTADTLTIDCDKEDFQIRGGLWDGNTLYKLYQQAYTPWEWHQALFEKAKELELTIFSSPFDYTAIELLEELGTPAYKIASFEAIDLPLVEAAARTGKPLIISTGMANEAEIQEAIDTARNAGCTELAILHCVSGYPSPAEQYNLRTIQDMQQRFDCTVGLSDHTIDNITAVTSVAMGAAIIEKHFTLDRNGGGPDDSFSLEPEDLTALCRDTKIAWQALGKVNYDLTDAEKGNLVFRRSLYAVKDIKAGEAITKDNVKSIRPGYGLAPKNLPDVLGQYAKDDIERGTAIAWELLKQ